MLSYEAIQSFVFQEARALDERRWADWLEFYAEDVEYWMPSWDDDDDDEFEEEDDLASGTDNSSVTKKLKFGNPVQQASDAKNPPLSSTKKNATGKEQTVASMMSTIAEELRVENNLPSNVEPLDTPKAVQQRQRLLSRRRRR